MALVELKYGDSVIYVDDEVTEEERGHKLVETEEDKLGKTQEFKPIDEKDLLGDTVSMEPIGEDYE